MLMQLFFYFVSACILCQDPHLPLSSLRLLVPPLRLMSACMWQVALERNVYQYEKIAEFIMLVTEMVPELLNYKQKTQLILGLRVQVSECGYQDSLWASFPALIFVERKQSK